MGKHPKTISKRLKNLFVIAHKYSVVTIEVLIYSMN